MQLHDAANAPRLVPAGGERYRVPAATLADLAEILLFLRDHVPPGADGAPAPFASEACQEAIFGPDGLPRVVFLALRRCQPGVTLADATRIALTMDPGEAAALAGAFFRRRDRAEAGGNGAKDLTELAWGRQLEMIRQRTGLRYDEVLGLSLDQYENLVTRGRADETWEGRPLSVEEAQALWEEAVRSGDGGNG